MTNPSPVNMVTPLMRVILPKSSLCRDQRSKYSKGLAGTKPRSTDRTVRPKLPP